MRSSRRPRRSSKRRRYGAKATPPWMGTARFGQRAAEQVLSSDLRRRQQQGVPAALAMGCERLVGHRDRLVAGRGPRRLRPVPRAARPRHVALALEGTGPQRAKVEILADADTGLVVLDRADSCEIVTPSEPRSLDRKSTR